MILPQPHHLSKDGLDNIPLCDKKLKVKYGSGIHRLLQLVLYFDCFASSAFENAYWP